MKIIIGLLMSIGFASFANAGDASGEIKASATMITTCSISANNVNFGVVSSPLTMQSSKSDMVVKCSNAAAYTIDLAYGNYVVDTMLDGYTIEYNFTNDFHSTHSIKDSSNKQYATLHCGYSAKYIGKVHIIGPAFAKIYGYTHAVWQIDSQKICSTDGTIEGTKPTGWVGAYNDRGKQSINMAKSSEFGVMSGALKGDKLAYKITVPGDITKVWNAGNNSYTATGTGVEQVIDMNAQIVPDKSSSKYVAQDVYSDTVTAIISY